MPDKVLLLHATELVAINLIAAIPKTLVDAKSVGLVCGCYNVIYPLPNDDPAKEAEYHYKTSEGVPSSIDLEYPLPQDWHARGITAASITALDT